MSIVLYSTHSKSKARLTAGLCSIPNCPIDLVVYRHRLTDFARTVSTDFKAIRRTLLQGIIKAYQSVSRSGPEVILWMVRSAPLNSSSALRRMPSVFFSRP